jgi:hypothetical protein
VYWRRSLSLVYSKTNIATDHVHETVAKPKTVSQRFQAGVALGSVDHSPTSRAHTRAPYSSTQPRLHSLPTRAHATLALWLTTLTHSRTNSGPTKTPVSRLCFGEVLLSLSLSLSPSLSLSLSHMLTHRCVSHPRVHTPCVHANQSNASSSESHPTQHLLIDESRGGPDEPIERRVRVCSGGGISGGGAGGSSCGDAGGGGRRSRRRLHEACVRQRRRRRRRR